MMEIERLKGLMEEDKRAEARAKAAKDGQQVLLDQIAHFFGHYKDLEKGKWVKVQGWSEREEAFELIRQGIERAENAGK